MSDLPTTIDYLLDGRIHLTQPAKGFRVGIDTVLLAAAVPQDRPGRVLDAGCGVGGALLCLAMRCPAHEGIGIEIQPDYATLARQNVTRQGWDHRITIHTGNVQDQSLLPPHSIDHAMMNPPYFAMGATPTPCRGRDIANRQQDDLATWFRAMRRLTRPGGTISVIYPASGLGDLLGWMEQGMGGLRILPIHPRANEAANRVLVQARIASKAPMMLLPGLTIHDAAGAYSPAAHAILRDMAPIIMAP